MSFFQTARKPENLPDVTWKVDARHKNVKWVTVEKIRDKEYSGLLTIQRLINDGWVKKHAGKPFYPITVTYNDFLDVYSIQNDSHRFVYCKAKGMKQVLVETPTIVRMKVKDNPRVRETEVWRYTDNVNNIGKKLEQYRKHYNKGKIEWVEIDGKVKIGEKK